MLQRWLGVRFGLLPDWVETKLKEANLSQLELWSERIENAKSLDEFFS